MKKVKSILKTAVGASLMVTAFIGCSKSSSSGNAADDQTTATTLSVSSATSDNLYGDALNEVLSVNDENGLSTNRLAAGGETDRADSLGGAHGCATVTVTPRDQSTYPKTIVIDYGSAGCAGANGIVRKGKITYTLSGKINSPGTSISVSFAGYTANGYALDGTYTITNSSSGAAPVLTSQISDGKVTYPDGTWYSYSGTKTMVQTAGIGTSTPSDDAFSITGSNTCGNSAGKNLTATITTALNKSNGCKNIVSGTIAIAYNQIKGVFDYGNGTCDNQATLTIGNNVQVITLP